MSRIKVFSPHPGKQMLFATTAADEVLFGGGKKSGKSKLGPATAVVLSPYTLLCEKCRRIYSVDGRGAKTPCDCGVPGRRNAYVEDPRFRMIVLRRESPDLEYIIDQARETYKACCPGVDENLKYRRFTFPHPFEDVPGAKVWFTFCADKKDVENVQGWGFQKALFDELSQWPDDDCWLGVGMELYADVDPETGRPWMRVQQLATTNPLSRGHTWILDRWMLDQYPQGGVLLYDETSGKHRFYIHATVEDNPSVSLMDYERQLRCMPPAMYKAYRYGDWSAQPGSAFGEDFSPLIHVIEGDWTIPEGWDCYLSGDYGYHTWAVYHVWASDPDSHAIVCVGEKAFHKVSAREQALQLKRYLRDELQVGLDEIDLAVLDPSAWGEGTFGHSEVSAAYEMMAVGIPWQKANNDRALGFQAVTSRLRRTVALENGQNIPAIRFVRKRCPRLIHRLPSLPRKPNEEDVDKMEAKKGDQGRGIDHEYDSCRYVCTAIARASQPLTRKEEEEAEIEKILARQRARTTSDSTSHERKQHAY